MLLAPDGDGAVLAIGQASHALEVRVEGRRLGPVPDEAALHAALDRAPLRTVRMVLRPQRCG